MGSGRGTVGLTDTEATGLEVHEMDDCSKADRAE
jgi:hypothetical protein